MQYKSVRGVLTLIELILCQPQTSSSISSEGEELFPIDLPEQSSETTAEVAKRLMTTVQVGDYRRQYRSLTTVKPLSAATHSR